MNPIEIPVSELLVSDNATILSKLNPNGIAIIKLSDITRTQRDLALENTKFYTAEGKSKKDAEQNSAILCLQHIKNL